MTTAFTATFNGTDGIIIPGGTVSAAEIYDGIFSYFHDVTGDVLDAQIAFEGSAWSIPVFQLSANGEDGASVNATFTDGDGADRRIDLMQFFSAGDVTITLDTTALGNLRGFGGDFTVSLGSGGARSINLRGDTHNVTLTGGEVDMLWLRGDSTLDLDATLGTINLGRGTANQVILRGTATVNLVREFSNSLTLDLRGNASVDTVEAIRSDVTVNAGKTTQLRTLDVSRGSLDLTAISAAEIGTAAITNSEVTLSLANKTTLASLDVFNGTLDLTMGGTSLLRSLQVEQAGTTLSLSGSSRITAADVNGTGSTVTVNGSARIDDLRIEDGTHSLTGTGSVGTLTAYGTKLTVDLAQGARTVGVFADGTAETHQISLGGVTALTISDDADLQTDNQRTNLTLTGDSGAIRLANGNDTVTLSDISVDSLGTRAGNDQVTHGGGQIGILRLGAGNDQLRLSALEAGETVSVTGGTGTDTINFNAISTGVSFALNARGALQTLSQDAGSLAETGIENLIGSTGRDRLTGDFAANSLKGGRGNDTLDGGSGADRLDGGAGRDRLTGGFGEDQFFFSGKSGSDVITDFAIGFDVIHLKSQSSFDTLSFEDSGNALRITHDNGVIDLLGRAGVTLTEDDFIFG